jgi:hypothetical protein
MSEIAKTSRSVVDQRFVFAVSDITAVGVLRTPTIERQRSPFGSVPSFLL